MDVREKVLLASILLGLPLACARGGAGEAGPDAQAVPPGRPIVLETSKYGPYFRRTCEAEERLLAGELEPALRAYQAAFASVGFPFPPHCCIPAQVPASLHAHP